MGITKQYLRYVPLSNFNIISHPDCNIVFVTLNGISDRFIAVGACENVIIWDLRLSKLVMTIEDEDMKNNTLRKANVVKLTTTSESNHIAVGYSDGLVNTFNLKTGELIGTFQGHRSAISALNYNTQGYLLASGSKDTEVVIWDVIAEKGLHRLSGHKGTVTAVQFINKLNIVVTSSKDTYIKFWDLTTGHCFKTLAGHITEVWTLSVLRNEDYLVSGSNDAELRTWKISKTNFENSEIKISELLTSESLPNFDSVIKCEKAGSLIKENPGRVVYSATDKTNHILCCHGNGKLLELFHFTGDFQALERFRNRQRKFRKKASKLGENIENKEFLNENTPTLKDVVRRLPSILTDFKIKSVDLVLNQTHVKVIVSLANNSLALYHISLTDSKDVKLIGKISQNGHRFNVKVVSFCSDNLIIFTGGMESVKMWNRKTLNCIRTVNTLSPVLCLCVVPGDKHILAGLENGQLLVIDVSAGEILESIIASQTDLRSIYMLPDNINCVSASDSSVKLWQLELITLPDSSKKVLSLLHLKTLKLDENIKCIKISPDNKLLAIALFDNNVKIFFMDSFKHFIDLYGHSLPVNSLDISYDSSIIITASADKTIRIWGLDYGDCHKRLMTDSALNCIQFIPKTHQFFTADNNGNIKLWDADIFERVLTIQGHRGLCQNLSVSESGNYVVSCGQDNVLRLFEKTEEILVLDDERENERTQENDKELATGDDTNIQGGTVLALTSKKTISSEQSAELLLECLNVIKEYKNTLLNNENINSNNLSLPLIMEAFNVKTTDDYLLEIIKRIRLSELEEVLLLIPFPTVCYFMESIIPLLNQVYHEIEVVVRSMVFLIQVLHKPISSVKNMMPILMQLNSLATKQTNTYRDLVGENLHSLKFLNDVQKEEKLINSITQNLGKKRKRQKQKLLKTVIVNI